MTVTAVHKDPAARTLVLEAEFAATPDRVWRLWSDPRQLERWWGPPAYPATITSHDLRVGGRVDYHMTGPEGDQPMGYWEIDEVEPPHRLVFRDRFANEDGTPDTRFPESTARVIIEVIGDGKTRMSIENIFPSTEAMEQLLGMGMEEGLQQAVGQIDAILAEETGAAGPGIPRMTAAPIILVPGFWLGAWAWDEVAEALRADGHEVTALTLPGLESVDADRSRISFADHVDAICDAVRAARAPVVLAVHSAAGFSGYAASDRIPDRIAAMIYVDTAPGVGALDPEFDGVDKPMVWDDIEAEENLDGLSDEQKETFRQRAVPEPGGLIREGARLTNDARRDIPSTIICTGFPSEKVKAYAREHDWVFLAGIPELRDITWVDLPTSHWPMWSRPSELTEIIGEVARAHAPGARPA
jgi:uncharacterized protein YndB with AHSA1/START domain